MFYFFTIPDLISSIAIVDSNLKCMDILPVVKKFRNLRKLIVSRANMRSVFNCHQKPTHFTTSSHNKESLQILDLSVNNITKVEKNILDNFSQLKVLNLSTNEIASLDSKLFENLQMLEVLDLSSNKLNHMIDPQSFLSLSPRLSFIDISGNFYGYK